MTGARAGEVERILLVGFMASGKSTVGRELACSMGWRFVDVDAEVERRAGRTIPDLFREDGEAAFRRLEDRTARELLQEPGVVMATGGGWPCVDGRLDALDAGTGVVWLKVDAETAAERAGADPTVRPLLSGPDPAAQAATLLAERERFYRRARVHVETRGRAPFDIAQEIRRALFDPPIPDVDPDPRSR